MNLSRCNNGHFFDKEKYASCPHCAGGAAADGSLTTVFTEDAGSQSAVPGTMALEEPTEPLKEGTLPVDETPLPLAGTMEDVPTGVGMPGSVYQDTPTIPLDAGISYGNNGNIQTEPVYSDDDHTVAFYDDMFSSVTPTTAPPVSGSVAANKVSSPCVGWLVAIGGEHIGQDFRLKVGKNFIGRELQMDIPLTGDKSVSRNRHAIVVYEPKQHLYLVQPGESSGLVYKNNKVVLSPAKLEAYDMITVGEVNLLFMPLCGTRFNWSELLEEMSKKDQ